VEISMQQTGTLANTTCALWRDRLVRAATGGRNHWRTKTAYYQAVTELIADGQAESLSWRTVVDAVRPRGSRTTFYDVAGSHAIDSMMDRFRAAESTIQIAVCYVRDTAVHQLVDEVKVWTYWPHRVSWLNRHQTTSASLTSVVADWARGNPALAAALNWAPPACAVEDLTTLEPNLPAVRAYLRLAQAMREATGGSAAEDVDEFASVFFASRRVRLTPLPAVALA
jgi:hypothetical protein